MKKLTYLTAEDRGLVRCAYDVAERQHRGQFRSSGDDFITHPLAVADILADLQADALTLAAGLLHDTVEDTDYTISVLEEEFGFKVKNLVLGVTKLSKQTKPAIGNPTDSHGQPEPSAEPGSNGHRRQVPTRQAEWAENMRQLFLSSAEHPLILVIKLADRLHNMRTLEAIDNEDKRRRIARETMDIFRARG